MIKHQIFALSACTLFLTASACFGNSYGPVEVVEPVAKSQLWLNPGLLSYHFDRNKEFNSINYGFGGEYKFSSVASFTIGEYRNSYYQRSNYIGAYWQPIAVGPINIGVVAGGFNGYANTNNGGWFPALLPALTVEGDWVGFNLILIPTIPNRVSGSLSLQMKIKVFE